MTNATEAIDTSILEDRIVTLYPDSAEEYAELNGDLLAECEDSTELPGGGHSDGSGEEFGFDDFWGSRDGDSWRVHVSRQYAEAAE